MKVRSENIFFLLFALSGFSGLIYESIWTHYLKLFLGHAAYAQTLVLAIFMGGMAIGSWLCSRYSARWKNLLLGYAFAEGIVGLFALLFHEAFARTIEYSYAAIIPSLGLPASVVAFKWTAAALMILPQSILLGMTFPLMSAGILRLFPQRPGRTIAILYFANSLGAVLGVLASGFFLIKLAGLPGTIRMAGAINVGLAAVVWFLARGGHAETECCRVETEPAAPYRGSAWFRLFLLASLVTGAASFIYEIGWIRMLSLVLGSSTHAFELMLSSFILGLALGGLWIHRRIDRIAIPVRFLAKVQVVMGILALSTLLLYGSTFEAMQWIVKSLEKSDIGYTLFNLSSGAIAIAIMLPATFCAGMTLPLITCILFRQGHGERSIGVVYAANTVGAIIGVFFAIHLGMPLLGLKGLIAFGAGLDIALGVVLLWCAAAGYKSFRIPSVVTAAAICALIATLLFVNLDPYKMGSGVYRHGTMSTPGLSRVIYHRDGKTATISCFQNSFGLMTIRTNGKADAGIMMAEGDLTGSDESTMALLAAIPMALHPTAVTAASIGMGSGMTSHSLLLNPRLEGVDTIEIENLVVEAARNFGNRVELVYADPRSKIHIDDAKTFFSTHNRKYDIIVSEPSNPWVSGVAGLFSEEFYRQIKRHLNEDALFVQWVQLYEIDKELVVSVLKAISANFADFSVYMTNDSDMIIVARENGHLPEPDPGFLETPAVAAALKRVHVAGVQDIELRRVGTKKTLDRFLASFAIPANSDYYPVIDQNAARARFMGSSAEDLFDFSHVPLPALEMLSGEPPQRENTEVGFSPFFKKSHAAFTAMAFRDYLLIGGFADRYERIAAETREKAVLLRRQFYECGNPADPSAQAGALFEVAVGMIPYLTPAELDAVWAKLEAGPCAQSLSADQRQWLNLFKAVGRRDGRGMVESATALLNRAEHWPLGAVRYLVASAMLGAISQGDYAESSRLWAEYRPMIFPDGEPNLVFRMLAAESTGR